MNEKGSLSIHTENIFPIIKKFLYSDHEIFLRELVSNAVDATQKLQRLSSIGEYKGELGEQKVEVKVNKKLIDCEYCMEQLTDCEELKAAQEAYIEKLEREVYDKGWIERHKFGIGVVTGSGVTILAIVTAIKALKVIKAPLQFKVMVK